MNGLDLIKHFEGCKLEAYLDTGSVPTIGYGHTKGVKMGDTCTQEQADMWLDNEYFMSGEEVKAVVKVPLTDNQLGALISFVYNLGIRALILSTLLNKLNRGDYNGAAEEFDKWVYDNHVKLNGLVKRREAEKRLFQGETDGLW